MDLEAESVSDKMRRYINRELGWLDFNCRVLEEARRDSNPILERFRFLGITASNMDEFFMVRIAGVKQQVDEGYKKADESGYTPQVLLEELYKRTENFSQMQYACLRDRLYPALIENGIKFLGIQELSRKQKTYVREYFDSVVFPVLTPIRVEDGRPFPRLLGKSLNIAVRLKKKGKNDCDFAVVQVPSNIQRFVELPSSKDRAFIFLEDVILRHMDALFDAQRIKACAPFRITRNSDVEIDDEAPDLLEEVQKSIKKRKSGRPVRLEILKKCDVEIREFLMRRLHLKKAAVCKVEGPIDLTVFSKFAGISTEENMCFAPIVPVMPPADFVGYADDFYGAIRKRDRLVYHPYESFDVVISFIKHAAMDPNVLAIKQTLYRVSGHSPIIEALILAAQNGKQVTVLVELKARFDEENNVEWAKKLEKAGCHVIYGLPGLKTHCKILSVVRREGDKIRNYIHMATGNYNDTTANLYTDMGMFTCREDIARDVAALFNMLTGYAGVPQYKKLVVAPKYMRDFFEEKIDNEIANAQAGLPCGITAKVNSLVDPGIVDLLYRASGEGVPVRLIVRGICCLLPGKKGLSENIEVHSIVGQLLEHSRIFWFENDGKPQVYIGSADWMQRNLNRRVEVVFPVVEKQLIKRIKRILALMWEDKHNTRVMQPDGSYQLYPLQEGESENNSQRQLSGMAVEAQERVIQANRRREPRQTLNDAMKK